MGFVQYLLSRRPETRSDLRRARMDIAPEAFIERTVRLALLLGVVAAALVFLFLSKQGVPLWAIPLSFVVGTLVGYWYLVQTPILAAQKIANDIDREVLFAGRFLLIKINSGTPLVNALVEASHSYGVANKYFAEIVRDIELGTPLEDAIERAMVNSPSKHWRKILFQIHNALRLGIDVTHSLEAVLEDINTDYLLQIQRYGKKLSSMTLFYLLVAVVFPSLGMTILVVLLSFTSVTLDAGLFTIVLVFVAFIQLIFVRIFLSIRPKVTL